jgi:hypothetical protein
MVVNFVKLFFTFMRRKRAILILKFIALGEVKEIRDLGEVKKSKGAIFTSLIKKYAGQQKVKL